MHQLTRWALRAPGLALGVVLLISALLGAGLLRLSTDVGYRAFLGPDHPAVARFDAFLERFGGGLPVAIAWSCGDGDPCESVFDPASLRMAHQVALALQAVPGVARAEGPATTPLLVPIPDGFAARLFVEDGELAADRSALAERALGDPLWVGSLVSADGQVGAIVLELASSASADSQRLFAELERVLAPYRAQGFEYRLVGGPVDFVVAGGELRRATERLVPLVALAVSLVVWLLVSSLAGVAVTLGSMGLAVLWTMGVLGWLDWPQNTLTQTLPPLVLVIGSCTGIHVLSRYASETAKGSGAARAGRERALERVARDLGAPCALTTLTTAGALASFATSGLESFVRFGLVAALGVGFTLLLSFTLLPILLARIPQGQLPGPATTALWERTLGGLVHFSGRYARPLLATALVGVLVCGWGALQLRVDVSFEDLYGEDSQIVTWSRFVETHLRKPETLEVQLSLPEGESIAAPEALREVQELASFLDGLPGLGPVHSVVGPLSRIHRLVQDDDARFERVADTRRANAQLLSLIALDDPHRLQPWVTLDRRHTRVSAQARKVPQDQLGTWIVKAEAYLAQELPVGWNAELTGAADVIYHMTGEIRRTQLTSFAAAGAVVLLAVAVFLRSVAWALLAMVPTGLPVVVTLGTMGLLRVPLDPGTAMVAAVVLGIAIDDTIHLLTQYGRRRNMGLPVRDAISRAVPHVGRALVTTSIALVLGFLSLLVSPWQSVASFGAVAAIAIAGALVADLVVLPALLIALAGLRPLSKERSCPIEHERRAHT